MNLLRPLRCLLSTPRLWCHFLVLAALCGPTACAQDTVVYVAVSGLLDPTKSLQPGQTTSLQVTTCFIDKHRTAVQCDGKKPSEEQHFQQNLDHFAVLLPPSTGSDLTLHINVEEQIKVPGLDSQYCTVQSGQTNVDLVSSLNPATVALSPLGLEVSRVDPTRGPISGGTQITINGHGFTAESEIQFGGEKASTLYTPINPCQVIALLPPYPYAPGRVPMIITDRGVDQSKGFYYYPPGKLDFVQPPTRRYNTGSNPWEVAIGKLNKDNHSDLVVTNRENDTISVLFGKGDGTFIYSRDYRTDRGPFAVTIADLDRDASMDLVVINQSADTVTVLLNDGNGEFKVKRDFQTGKRPAGVSVGDLNQDDIPDLVTANYDGGTVSVMLGNGDGSFRKGIDIDSVYGPQSVLIYDLNGDGASDLAVANQLGSQISIHLGNGNGTFQAPKRFIDASPFSVVAGDLNGDKIPDLVTANFFSQSVSVFIGLGNGSFQEKRDLRSSSSPERAVVTDVNLDGHADIVATNYGSNSVSVFINRGDGTFNPHITSYVGIAPVGLSIEEIDGDMIPDLVFTSSVGNYVSVLAGHKNGRFYNSPEKFAA